MLKNQPDKPTNAQAARDVLARYRRMRPTDSAPAVDVLARYRRPKGAAADVSEHKADPLAAYRAAPRDKSFESLLRAALQPPVDSMQKHIDSMLNSRKR